MHSYSHKYKEIYASKEAFTEDLERLQNFLYETTGVWSRFYRFPGGSANEVSSVDMNTLAEYLTEENIYYLDWNVSCQDATGKKKKPQELADNVIDNITYYNTAVVLLHDGADKTSTVEALPIILTQLRQMENVSILPVSDEMNLIQQLKEHRETED
jgi:peptidoglycan/xylan/chitin deacetylase (PgdA/CDA1 family)